MADLIRMYAQSAIVMNGLPIAAAVAGLALIGGIAYEAAEHVEKLKKEHEKLADDIMGLGTSINETYRGLDDRLLEAGIRSDELRNNHLAALAKQLQLINNQSMEELVKSLGLVDKAADAVFADLKSKWYTFGQGSDGAKHALDQFEIKYKSLLAQGKDGEASGFLKGTLDQAREVLRLQDVMAKHPGSDQTDESFAAQLKLRQLGAGYTEKEVQAQQQLVDALTAQTVVEDKVNALKKLDSGNAKTTEGNQAAERRAQAARQSAQTMLAMGQQSLAADKATADALLETHRASLEARFASDVDFAGRERDVQLAANAAQIAALDRSGKDYQNQLKALQDKALEISNEYDAKVAELRAKSSVEMYNRDIQALEQSNREKIEATRQGSAARLAAVNEAIKAEEAANLQQTQNYRDLLNQRVQITRQMAEDDAKDKETAAREEASNAEKMGELALAAEKQHIALLDSARRVSIQQRIAEEMRLENESFAMKQAAMRREIQGLDKNGKDYESKLKQLQDKETQMTRAHENELTAIKEKAEIERNDRLANSASRFNDAIASGLTDSIMRHQTWAQTMLSLGDQVVGGMIKNALMSIMADDMTRERDAAAAARDGFKAGMKLPFPANIAAAPVLAAAAFTSVMAFAGGTDRVPGVGHGDVVPAMLSPGEGIVPGGVMDGLRNMARNGGFDGGPRNHVTMQVHMHASALDADGMDRVLEKHSDKLQRHFESTLRRLNK